MRKGVVDSFEDNGELVVIELEDKTTIAVPKDKFICEVHVNDVVYETESGLWQVDREETKSKLEEVQNLMDELWEKEE
ncbi:DUF3006 domain-containing protein [Coprothermobacter proteolyticus]|nr:DUF3006 domain-containing protein [Coprothermobacter proteolyticus]